MSDRLTRKEIKQQDSFQTTMALALDTVQRYRTHLIVGAVAVVVVVLAVVAFAFYSASRERQAQAVLADAIAAHGGPAAAAAGEEADPTRARELFEQIRDEYPRSDAATVAASYLGGFAAREGDTERARELWEEYLDEQPDGLISANIRVNLLALDRAAGRGEEVVAELEEMLGDEDRLLPEDVVLYQLALTLDELGRAEEAESHYQRLADEYPGSPYGQLARRKVGAPAAPAFAGLPS